MSGVPPKAKPAAAPAATPAPAKPVAPAAPATPAAAPAAAAAEPAKAAAAAPAAPAATPKAEPKPPAKPAPAADPATAASDVPKLGDTPVDEADAGDDEQVPALGDAPVDEPDDAGEPAKEGDQGDGSETKDGEAEGDKPADAPLEYSFEPPEGQAPYQPELIDAYTQVLQKHRVDPAVAQDILQTMLPAIQADVDRQFAVAMEAKTTEWRAELEQRHGKNLRSVMNAANRGLAKAASPSLINFIRESALAWHPDFVDAWAWLGQRVSNDRSVKSTEGPPPQPVDAEAQAAAEYDRNAKKRG